MKISVTGASGHVGANLIRELLNLNHEVRVLYYKDERGFAGLPVQAIKGNLFDLNALNELIKGSEIVIHLAAQISISGDRDGSVFRINTEGTRNVCQSCLENHVRRLIHFSSIHAYNARPFEGILDESRKMVDETAFRYDFSKATGQNIVMEYVSKGLDAVVLNPTSIIGPFDYKPSLMGQVFLQLYKRELPALVHGGYDFVDARDVAHAAILSIDKGKCGEKYLIGGTWKTIKELGDLVHKVTGKKPPRFIAPFWLANVGVPFLWLWAKMLNKRPIYTRESLDILKNAHRNVCHQKAADELGFTARPLEETISDIYSWYREHHYIDN